MIKQMLWLLLLALAVPSAVHGQQAGLSLGLKGGANWIDDPRTGSQDTMGLVEAEIESPRMWGGKLSILVTVGKLFVSDTTIRTDRWQVDEVTYFESDKLTFELWQTRLGVRVWPWPDARPSPYISLGAGYYEHGQKTYRALASTWNDPDTGNAQRERTTTTVSQTRNRGVFPWIGLGMELPIRSHAQGTMSVLIEAQYDFDKRALGADIGQFSLLAGLRWRM